MITTQVSHYTFIAHLESFVSEKNRGALATLRRGLGKQPGTVREMDSYVLPSVPSDVTGKQEDVYYLISALFAYWYQSRDDIVKNRPANLGDSIRLLVNYETATGANKEDVEKRIEKRLVSLLNCHRDDLPEHLRYIIGLLKSKDIPIDWARLLSDILSWQHEDRSVQRRWARYFWRNYYEKNQSEPENEIQKITNNSEE
jgi:CRISPR system Cascade subunit CasB